MQNNKMNSQQTFSDDQFWQAFQFVAGELPDAQSEAFELQMLDSPTLCEAVSEAVRLSAAVAAGVESPKPIARPTIVRCESPSRRRRSFGKSVVAISATVCCCLLLLLVVSSDSNFESAIAIDDDATEEAELLVSAWASGFADDVGDEADDAEFDQQELDVPDWMLAAVTLTDDDEENL